MEVGEMYSSRCCKGGINNGIMVRIGSKAIGLERNNLWNPGKKSLFCSLTLYSLLIRIFMI